MSEAVGKQAVLQMKYARIIRLVSAGAGVSIEQATDMFYNSPMFPLIQDGVADLHCRSDEYLAGEILRDYPETGFNAV
jgi:hypothetical protein